MLSKRLQRVAEFVSPGAIVADIGSDHAYLPCALVSQGVIAKAYACEVKEGPLQSSIRTIESRQLCGKVIPVLSDGLERVPDDVTEIVIAGMGVFTILEILQNGMHRLARFQRIIVQANQNVELLREFISQHCFRIIDEAIVFEDKYYEIVVFEASKGKALTAAECYFGPCLLKAQSDIFRQYYQSRVDALRNITEALPEEHERRQSLADEIKWIQRHVSGII